MVEALIHDPHDLNTPLGRHWKGRDGMKICTQYWANPIPIRQFDWSAIFDDSADDDCLVGYGATEAEAILDLENLLNE